MNQTAVGILCLLVGILGTALQVPQSRLAILQLRERHGKKAKMPESRWKLFIPFATMAVCLTVGAIGALVLAKSRKQDASAANTGQPQGQAKPAPQPAVPSNIPESKPDHPKPTRPATPNQTVAPTQSPQQSVGGVDCTANQGNCAGINNGQQITNQFGAPKRNLSDSERTYWASCLSRHPGTVVVQSQMGDAEAADFAEDWVSVFKSAGWSFDGVPGVGQYGSIRPETGITIGISERGEQELAATPNSPEHTFTDCWIKDPSKLPTLKVNAGAPGVREGHLHLYVGSRDQ